MDGQSGATSLHQQDPSRQIPATQPFDAARKEAIGRLLTRRPHPQVEKVFETFGLLAIAGTARVLAGELAGELGPQLQDGVTGVVAILLLLVLLVPSVRRRLHRALSFYGRR